MVSVSQESRIPSHESRLVDVRGALKESIARLSEAGTPSHALAAELLLMHVLGRERAWIYAHPEHPLAAGERDRYLALVAQRAAGTPTQYLTGKQEFWGLEFEVTPDVLIPRPETEHVVEAALERVGAEQRQARVRVADVGTGSGCLAIALAHELPNAEIVATDISEAALSVARRNAERHGVASRITFAQSNLLEAFLHESFLFDVIVSNPPYIGREEAKELQREVREHEPAHALFGGEEGTEIYGPLIAQAEKLLHPGAALVLELGYESLASVHPLVATLAWTDVRVTNDLAGLPRVLSALRA